MQFTINHSWKFLCWKLQIPFSWSSSHMVEGGVLQEVFFFFSFVWVQNFLQKHYFIGYSHPLESWSPFLPCSSNRVSSAYVYLRMQTSTFKACFTLGKYFLTLVLIGFLSWHISILSLNIVFKFMQEIPLCPPQILIILIQIWGYRRLPSATLPLLAEYHSDDVLSVWTVVLSFMK